MKSTAPGPDQVHTAMLKHLPDSSLHELLRFFSQVRKSEILPTTWHEAHFVPLLKLTKILPIYPVIALLKPEERYCTLQQDNATAHTATDTLNMLKEFFDDRLISKNHWLLCSPDLSLADYFCGILKRQGVYEYTADTERFTSEYYC